jgi:hypothetical protein
MEKILVNAFKIMILLYVLNISFAVYLSASCTKSKKHSSTNKIESTDAQAVAISISVSMPVRLPVGLFGLQRNTTPGEAVIIADAMLLSMAKPVSFFNT